MVSVLLLLGSGANLVSAWCLYQYVRRQLLRIHGTISNDESLYLLKFSPSRLTPQDIFLIVGSIAWKYFPSPIGPAYRLLPRKEQDGFELPTLAIKAPLIFTALELDTFSQAIFSSDPAVVQNEAAFKNPFLLISLTTPLMLILLSHPKCPIKPFGAVNTDNAFSFHDPRLLRDPAELLRAAENGELSARAEMGGSNHYGQRRRRGFQFMVTVTVYSKGKPLITQELSFLQFLPKSHKPLYREPAQTQAETDTSLIPSAKSQGLIDLDTKAPLRWAASCRDYNPIHISRLLARAFGFPSTIAHGNHVVALALQQLYIDTTTRIPNARESLQNQPLGAARDLCWESTRPTKFEVSFLKPTLLPTTLDVHWSSAEGGAVALLISKGDTVRVRGAFSYL